LDLQEYRIVFLEYLSKKIIRNENLKQPQNLYDPIHYILQLGGKRIRPILTLMSCDLFGENHQKALDAALAIEMFHNFTLIHDDIMDRATLRRGKETVHKKWDENTGILSGDALMILSNQLLGNYKDNIFKELYTLFNNTALEICEGQQFDMDFETRSDVTLDEYILMIKYKTAVLIACSLKMGAIIANADKKDADLIYEYGINLGLAFQLQDDFLDTFGTDEFGKKVGGDIIENKKTYLIIKTLELASIEDEKRLLNLYSTDSNSLEKINEVKSLIIEYDVNSLIKKEIKNYTEKAFQKIELLKLNEQGKNSLIDFGNGLMNRKL